MSITIRPAEEADQKYLVEWLLQPGVLEGFPLYDLREIEDAAKLWMSYSNQGSALMALWNGEPCGTAVLYISPYQKLAHQCLFAIIVDEKRRGQGVGTELLSALIKLAKEKFHISLLHLEVYEGNRAIELYQKLGFVRYGLQRHFVKVPHEHRYIGKIMMQKRL
jgi:RimJ/RimL family protein N-acetyltransferase